MARTDFIAALAGERRPFLTFAVTCPDLSSSGVVLQIISLGC
jgi:hypothetical protein